MKQNERVSVESGIVLIEPEAAGSVVHWAVAVNEYRRKDQSLDSVSIDGHVTLSDCNRQITWNFDYYGINKPDSIDIGKIEKIDRAILELQKFKKALCTAHKRATRAASNIIEQEGE